MELKSGIHTNRRKFILLYCENILHVRDICDINRALYLFILKESYDEYPENAMRRNLENAPPFTQYAENGHE
jgi:hypothetical protein